MLDIAIKMTHRKLAPRKATLISSQFQRSHSKPELSQAKVQEFFAKRYLLDDFFFISVRNRIPIAPDQIEQNEIRRRANSSMDCNEFRTTDAFGFKLDTPLPADTLEKLKEFSNQLKQRNTPKGSLEDNLISKEEISMQGKYLLREALGFGSYGEVYYNIIAMHSMGLLTAIISCFVIYVFGLGVNCSSLALQYSANFCTYTVYVLIRIWNMIIDLCYACTDDSYVCLL